MEYLAKWNKVWKNRRTGIIHGNKIKLKENENIMDYMEVSPEKKLKNKLDKKDNSKGAY